MLRTRDLTIATFALGLAAGACTEGTPVEPVGAALATGGAPTIKRIPADDPGPPWYTPVFGGGPVLPGAYIPNDGTWVVVPFWRSPDCVPAGFNLFQLMNPPAAFGCPLTVQGRIWTDPDAPIPPLQERYEGLGAVPVAFVLLAELQGVMGDSPADADFDPDLFLPELTGLPSYSLGVAFEFRTVIHNSVMASAPGHEVVDARGFVESGALAGSTFRYHHNERFDPGSGVHSFQNVTVTFD
jgi:hypothetical protein